jgi:hypothetical protein
MSLSNLFGGSGSFNIAGGFNLAQLDLDAQRLALQSELSRQEFGRSLLQQLLDVQRDPFSIVPALTAFGAGGQAGGGGVLAPATDLARTGGAGRPAPAAFGDLASQLLQNAGMFATGPPQAKVIGVFRRNGRPWARVRLPSGQGRGNETGIISLDESRRGGLQTVQGRFGPYTVSVSPALDQLARQEARR